MRQYALDIGRRDLDNSFRLAVAESILERWRFRCDTDGVEQPNCATASGSGTQRL